MGGAVGRGVLGSTIQSGWGLGRSKGDGRAGGLCGNSGEIPRGLSLVANTSFFHQPHNSFQLALKPKPKI